jgi:hypothetical protein
MTDQNDVERLRRETLRALRIAEAERVLAAEARRSAVVWSRQAHKARVVAYIAACVILLMFVLMIMGGHW